ncbi:hypothetical protein FACS1894176_00410 [Bacteroidia bacterium]|nr:hypothetical protein FACS1894176_00410 [Bacteroidia bacterium]
MYQHFQSQYVHLGFVKDEYEIDFTNGETNWQVCRELNEENWVRESKFAEAKQNNVLITRYDHPFQKPNIVMKSRKEILLKGK